MKATVKMEQTYTILCPECGGKVSTYQHLIKDFPRQFGPWSCDDCNKRYRFQGNADGSVDIIDTLAVERKSASRK